MPPSATNENAAVDLRAEMNSKSLPCAGKLLV
jgi:hypothetical protein